MSILYFFKMSPVISFLIFTGIMLVIDLLLLNVLKKTIKTKPYYKTVWISFVLISSIYYVLLFFFYFIYNSYINAEKFSTVFVFTAQLIPMYIFKVFTLILSTLHWLFKKAKEIVVIVSFTLGIALFMVLQYGYWFGRFNYKVYEQTLNLGIPAQFKGLKIVQISDLHLGTVVNHANKLSSMIAEVNELNPDLVFITGDLVNCFAQESYPFINEFSQIKAKYGVFAIKGNHDYGDYYRWHSQSDYLRNLVLIDSFYNKSRIRLLNNENVAIEKMNQKIWVAGVENIGMPPFTNRGNIDTALSGIPDSSFILFLSHDPSIWQYKFKENKRLPITFSGHTHGFQFGSRSGKKPWSPLVWSKKMWCGLYEYDGRYLYVNVGQSGSFFPARLGMWPEITLFTIN